MQFCRITFATGAVLLLAACGSSSTTTVSPPPPPPSSGQHLYVGQNDLPGAIVVYALPLTSSSTPVATIPHDANVALAINSTTLAATRLTDYSVSFFALPVTSSSAPYATLTFGSLRTPLFLASGTLYLGAPDTIHVYTPPFASTSKPGSFIVTANVSPTHFAIDPNGNVYETFGNIIAVITNGALTTKLTATPGTGFSGIAATATQLFACEATGSSYHVYIYSLPLTASATPVTIMNPNTSSPNDCALDASGNLYIASAGSIVEYSPPFTASNARVVTITVQGSAGALAIGP